MNFTKKPEPRICTETSTAREHSPCCRHIFAGHEFLLLGLLRPSLFVVTAAVYLKRDRVAASARPPVMRDGER